MKNHTQIVQVFFIAVTLSFTPQSRAGLLEETSKKLHQHIDAGDEKCKNSNCPQLLATEIEAATKSLKSVELRKALQDFDSLVTWMQRSRNLDSVMLLGTALADGFTRAGLMQEATRLQKRLIAHFENPRATTKGTPDFTIVVSKLNLALGNIQAAQGLYEAGRQSLLRAVEDLSPSAPAGQKASVQLDLAKIEINMGKYAEAKERIEKARTISQDELGPLRLSNSWTSLSEATLFRCQKKFAEAERDVKEVLDKGKVNPKPTVIDVWARQMQGLNFKFEGKYEQAFKEFQTSLDFFNIAIDPKDRSRFWIYYELFSTAAILHRKDEALAYRAKMIESLGESELKAIEMPFIQFWDAWLSGKKEEQVRAAQVIEKKFGPFHSDYLVIKDLLLPKTP